MKIVSFHLVVFAVGDDRVIYVTIKYKCTFYKDNTLLCR